MSNPSDFVIENGILTKYVGPGGDVVIPAGVTSIGNEAFKWCWSLTSVTIPASVTSIGDEAFCGCSSLASVTIPDSVTSIGISAFWGCSSLTSVTIPESVTSIGDSAFERCSLETVNISDLRAWCKIKYGGGAFSHTYRLCMNGKPLQELVIPDSVTRIGNAAFFNCSGLTSVTIPESVTSIGWWAFSFCSSLTSVTIPDSVTSIGNRAFYGCGNVRFIGSAETLERLRQSFFQIENGILKKYQGPGGDVTIPESVTSIGNSAFWSCRSLTSVSIPESVTSIGGEAFSGCSGLTSVTIPDSVTSIGNRAFYGCGNVRFIGSAETLERLRQSFFQIENGILKKYQGPGGDVTIPDSVTNIGDQAFYKCSSLTSVTIPEGVNYLGWSAFSGCDQLERVEIYGELPKTGTQVFADCPKLKIYLPVGAGKTTSSIPTDYADAAQSMDEEDIAWILLFQTTKAWRTKAIDTAEQRNVGKILQLQIECLQGMKKVRQAVVDNAANACVGLSREAPEASVKALAGLLRERGWTKQLAVIEQDPVLREKLIGREEAQKDLSPADRLILSSLDAKGTSLKDLSRKLMEYMGLKNEDFAVLPCSDGKTCRPFVLSWLLTVHETMARGHWDQSVVVAEYKSPGLRPEAAELVALLDPKSLQAALRQLADEYLVAYQNTRKKFLAYPFCRYADEANMAELTKRAPKWATSVSGNDAPPLRQLRDAVKYSDTRAAMLFAERYHELDKYAALRGMTEDELRDKYLSDVGLDEQGGKAYDLGNQTVTARLQKDLSFLFELPGGKTAKSLPKKGAAPAKYEAAKADFDEMRKAVKKILKSRGSVLFGDFLSGRKRGGEEWKAAYLPNPVLRLAAGLIVWGQGKKTFTLSDGKPICSDGTAYEIGEQSVCVAHPMEMQPDEVKAWQKYFSSRGLKQPFAQVWEPVIDPATVKEDRYEGSVQPMVRFTGRDKHGIHSGSLHAYSEDIGFTLDDCKLDYEASTWWIDPWADKEETYTLGKFTFPKFTRKVNHIVSILDKWTVEDRIKKDDITVADRLDAFTLAQITEFIQTAQEAQAVNVLALLLDYKNAHFADFDPMDEFTLEW